MYSNSKIPKRNSNQELEIKKKNQDFKEIKKKEEEILPRQEHALPQASTCN
jgi:hypothetical protein